MPINIMRTKIISAVAMAAIASAFSIAPVFAQAPAARKNASGVTEAQRMAVLGAHGDKEIDVRVQSLNKLIARIQGLRNISDAQKSSIENTLQSIVTNLQTLKTQVDAATSTADLRSDDKAVIDNYRVYALVMPQLNIIAASDRIVTISQMLGSVSQKLQSRLSSASGISNLSALQSDLSDIAAKAADAASQAQAAVSEVSALVPDQGDKTKMASNTAALKDARSKIRAAQQDLVAARKDAEAIIQALVKWDKSVMSSSAAASSTEAASSSQQ
ncbi:MAG: hypothetical protein KGI66_00195 [Patescibacteria group bacterium]|nr:hypothetical protein [Patescibacteria group bacterium]